MPLVHMEAIQTGFFEGRRLGAESGKQANKDTDYVSHRSCLSNNIIHVKYKWI